MKINVHSSELNRMMKVIGKCIDSRFDKFSNIEIRHEDTCLMIRGQNGAYFAEMKTPLLGGDGERFCVDGDMFEKTVAQCGGEVEISTDGKVCTIKGAGRTRLPIIDTEVADVERLSDEHSLKIAPDKLAYCFDGVGYAISDDDSRLILTGALVETDRDGLKMVSLDGFRMSLERAECDWDNGVKAVIPGAFLKLLCGAVSGGGDVTIRTNGVRVEAETDSMRISCGLLTGEYPDYTKILPETFKTECLVKSAELIGALKGSAVVNNKANLVKMEIGGESIRVMNNGEKADYEAEIASRTHGDGLKIAFNLKYLLSTINSIGTDEVVLKFNSGVAPMVACGAGENSGVRLILPVRVAAG